MTLTTAAAPATDGVPRRPRTRLRARTIAVPLIAILVLQLVAMLTLQNTPFQDEALYLYAGHRILDNVFGGVPLHQSFSSFFSGLPYFQPVIAAALDSLGGYELARALSTVCALSITFATFRVARAMFGERVGVLSAAVVAAQSSLLFVGRLATYDAFSFALFAAAAMVGVEATKRVAGRTVAVVILCSLAVAAKYAVAAVIPAAVLLLWFAPGIARNRGTRANILFSAFVTLVGVAGIAYLLLHNDTDLITGLTQTTTSRDVGSRSPLSTMLPLIVRHIGIVTVLAAIGLIALGRWGLWRRTFLLNVALFVIALIIPAYHALAGETVSVDKHLALTGFLMAPLAGVALDSIIAMRSRIAGWSIAGAVLILSFSLAITDARSLFTAWPNTTALHRVLEQTVRYGDTRVLAEEAEVPEYYMVGSSAKYWQFTGLYFFQYTDAAGDPLSGQPAYEAAIREGYFGVIAFRFGSEATLARSLEKDITASGKYDKVATLPFTVSSGSGAYTVWRLNTTAASTTATATTP